MISSYVFRVKSADTLPAGRAYAFYSCLLSLLPADYVEALHAQGETPISQYLCREDGETFWQIHLLDQIADETVSPVLDELNAMPLHTGELELERTQRERFPAEELIQAAGRMEAERFFSLRFLSPVAFKRAGRYVVLPDKELLLQSVINKWNAAFPHYPLEDQDALRMLAEGVSISDYRLRTTRFSMKDNRIPGFIGEITFDARLSAPIMELWKMLLFFSGYSGVGIKTALGMGGVKLA